MKLTAAEKRKVKRLKHWLVAHGNTADMLRWPLPPILGVAPSDVERERRKIWNRLTKADTRLLKIAAEELNAQEMKWRAARLGRNG
jgi:hypothetical protein